MLFNSYIKHDFPSTSNTDFASGTVSTKGQRHKNETKLAMVTIKPIFASK